MRARAELATRDGLTSLLNAHGAAAVAAAERAEHYEQEADEYARRRQQPARAGGAQSRHDRLEHGADEQRGDERPHDDAHLREHEHDAEPDEPDDAEQRRPRVGGPHAERNRGPRRVIALMARTRQPIPTRASGGR